MANWLKIKREVNINEFHKRLYFHLRRAPFQSLAAALVTIFAFATSTVFFVNWNN